MQTALENPDVGNNRYNIETAFGQSANIPRIRDNVIRMQAATMNVHSVIPNPANRFYAAVSPKKDMQWKQVVVNGRTQYDRVGFGSAFFAPGYSMDDQAGTLIHEASHYAADTRDHVLQEVHPDGSFSHQMEQNNHNMNNPGKGHGLGCK